MSVSADKIHHKTIIEFMYMRPLLHVMLLNLFVCHGQSLLQIGAFGYLLQTVIKEFSTNMVRIIYVVRDCVILVTIRPSSDVNVSSN